MGRWASFEEDEGCCGNFECLAGSNLVLQIFARLGLRNLFIIRCVCKSWYDAILSLDFGKLWKDKDQEVWAVLAVRTEPPGFIEEESVLFWYPVSSVSENHREIWYPFRSISKSSERNTGRARHPATLSMPMLPSGTRFYGLLSLNGLVLGRLYDDTEDEDTIKLVVGNPLTNTWKFLPDAPLPPGITPYGFHDFFMERDPVSGCYTIVIFLNPWQNEYWYDILQYESESGTWYRGPAFNMSSINYDNLFQGSMAGLAPASDGYPFLPTYDSDAMAWSHMDISIPSVPQYDESEFWVDCYSIPLSIFKYGSKYIAAMCILRRVQGQERHDLGLGVIELDEGNSWQTVSLTTYEDLYGGPWWSDLGVNNWKCQLVGDMVIFSTNHKPSVHGFSPPVAFDLCRLIWTSALMEDEKCGEANFSPSIDYECIYAFIPSLDSRV